MSRFFVPKEAVSGKNILITGPEAHHILDVMRLKELDNVILTPHIGSYALESRIKMEIEAVKNLLKSLKRSVTKCQKKR